MRDGQTVALRLLRMATAAAKMGEDMVLALHMSDVATVLLKLFVGNEAAVWPEAFTKRAANRQAM
jgi:hypothetical protein